MYNVYAEKNEFKNVTRVCLNTSKPPCIHGLMQMKWQGNTVILSYFVNKKLYKRFYLEH